MPQYTSSVAIVQSPLFQVGDSTGNAFNDIESVIGTNNITINTANPIKEIVIIHGAVVDGIQVTYYKGKGTTTVTHGTSTKASDAYLHQVPVPIGPNETIVAISGMHGSSDYGIRMIQINFAIYDSGTGQMRTVGPYGNATGGTPFRVTANGSFVAFGGFAVNTDYSISQAQDAGEQGGIYGLTFQDIDYVSV